MTESTIAKHICQALEHGESVPLDKVTTTENRTRIREAFANHGMAPLTPVFEALGGMVSYDILRVIRAASPGGKEATAEASEIFTMRREEMRTVFPNTYSSFTAEEDRRLLELFAENADIESIATEMGRQPSSITARHLSLTDPAAAEAKSKAIKTALVPGQAKGWSCDDDILLRALVKAGKKSDQLSIILQRPPNEIKERMKELGVK